MKTVVVLSLVVAAAWSTPGDQKAREKLYQDTLKSLKDVTTLLQTVKDAKSAGEAIAQLEDPADRLMTRMDALKALTEEKGLEDLEKKYRPHYIEAYLAMMAEVDRIAKQPKVAAVLEKNAVWKKTGEYLHASRFEQAREDLKALEKAVLTWINKRGDYPESLAKLAEKGDGKLGLIPERLLTDPWGRPYQYDRNLNNPNTGVPKIWSDGPDPKDPKGRLSNW
jgi:hypothetical protein